MLYFITELLGVSTFSSTYLRSFLSFIIAFSLVVLVGKPFINYLRRLKLGEGIREDGPESHKAKQGTPTMGGVLIVISILISVLLVANLQNKFIPLLIGVTLIFAGIGFIDDYKKFTESKDGLSGKKKILGQTLASVIVFIFIKTQGLTGSERADTALINPVGIDSYLAIGSILFFILVVLILVGSSNAVNLTDGLDGLVIMPVIIASTVLAALAYFASNMTFSSELHVLYIDGAGEITVFLGAVVGAGLGFLWYNSYPAQIFMGDTGSLTLGGILGCVAILIKQELLFPVIGFVFVLEAMSVIIQVGSYKLRGKRVFKMAPIHHHFEISGVPESKVTMRLWILALMCGILALGLVRIKGVL